MQAEEKVEYGRSPMVAILKYLYLLDVAQRQLQNGLNRFPGYPMKEEPDAS